MSFEPLEEYKVHCLHAQKPSDSCFSDGGFATALVAEALARLARSVNELREMLKDRWSES